MVRPWAPTFTLTRASIGLEISHITEMEMDVITILGINREILTAMRVCEDALRYKMILCFGRGRSFWTWWGPNLKPAVDYLLHFSGGTSRVFHWSVFLFYLIASLRGVWAFFVHARHSILSSVEERRLDYVVCCVKPVPRFLRAHSVTAMLDNSLVILARTEPAPLPRTVASAD